MITKIKEMNFVRRKNENFIAGVRKMRNASGQQGENERQ